MLNLYPPHLKSHEVKRLRNEIVLKTVILAVKQNRLQKFNEKFGFG